MFGIFKKKSKVELLTVAHQKLLKEAFDLSKINRTKSDEKYAEAEVLSDQIMAAKKASGE